MGEIPLSAAHSEPVFKTMWISSKTGSEFFTASSDGKVCLGWVTCKHPDILNIKVLWWDTRSFTEPVDRLVLDPYLEDEDNVSRAQGASILEYEWTIPSKFMVGTQQGKTRNSD